VWSGTFAFRAGPAGQARRMAWKALSQRRSFYVEVLEPASPGRRGFAHNLKYPIWPSRKVVELTGQELELRLLAGFIVVLSSTLLLDKVGDYLYHMGIAKPFYLLGHRLHHRSFLLALAPASYLAVGTLIFLHYVRVVWSSFWPTVEVTLFLAGICLTLDFALDALSTKEKRRALLHHEWVYLVVPAYVFTHVVAFV
jgi:hypothetical protein